MDDYNDIVKINNYQKDLYLNLEKKSAKLLLGRYAAVLENVASKNEKIKILDIGGASGYFSEALYDFFQGKNCEITLIDTIVYDTWDGFAAKINFIHESASNLEKIFPTGAFDIIFANRVFHHFVTDSWKKSISHIDDIMRQMSVILKDSGQLCIMDNFYNGLLFDSAASKMIYALTTCKIPFIVKRFNRLGSKSAGVGVCFLSKKMWYKLIKKNKLIIKKSDDGKFFGLEEIWNKSIYKICLLLKSARNDAILIIEKEYGSLHSR
jgi:SAM-dependent methyltransferase